MAISYTRRKKVYTRDDFTCRYCKRKAEQIIEQRGTKGMLITLYMSGDWRPFELDHKKPKSKGGTNNPRNLLTSCARCNSKKGTKSFKIFTLEIWQKTD